MHLYFTLYAIDLEGFVQLGYKAYIAKSNERRPPINASSHTNELRY